MCMQLSTELFRMDNRSDAHVFSILAKFAYKCHRLKLHLSAAMS